MKVVGGGSRRYPRKVLMPLAWLVEQVRRPRREATLRGSRKQSLPRLFPHHSEVVLGVLVVVLGFDGVAGQGGGAREFDVSRVLRLWVNALIGSAPSGAG